MSIKIREQAGTDAVRKFDYQMAVALDYLLNEIDSDAIVLIETLEDFAVFRNVGLEDETVDVYQVKTKDKGLYSKSTLNSDNVLGKIILTDFYFDSKANTLNIVCNTSLKGRSTEELDYFSFIEKLTEKELSGLKACVTEYLGKYPDFSGQVEDYWGKLIYIKSSLPFSGKEERYEETLVGKTNSTIAHYLGDENHSINPQAVFNTLKLLIDRQRRYKITSPEIEVDEALARKGISSEQLKKVIDVAVDTNHLSKNEILYHASTIFTPQEYMEIKQDYSTFLSYRASLVDHAFVEARTIIEQEYQKLTSQYDSLDEIVRQQRHKNMKNIKATNTSIEVALRKALWHKGYRYCKNDKTLPGEPDIVITKYKIAIFCDSEFFHGKDWEILRPRLEKGNNSQYWVNKISRNRKRDDEINKQLLYAGWSVIRFWGNDIKQHTDECVKVIEETIADIILSDVRDFEEEF